MIVSPAELESYLFSSVPEQFLRETVRAVWAVYRALARDCARYDKPEREYMRGHFRRANLESAWRKLARNFKELKVSVKANKSENIKFTVIKAGRLRLTASAISSPGSVPREAIYRTNLASSQLKLLEANTKLPPTRALYGILTHGWGRDLVSPGFVSIAFPSADCKSLLTSISLAHHFSDLWEEETTKKPVAKITRLEDVALHSQSVDLDSPEAVEEEIIAENITLNLRKQEAQDEES